MVIKPIEFAMIQQQNTVSQIQHNAETRAMTEQQTISQQFQKDVNNNAEQVKRKDNADNNGGNFDAKEKSNNEYHSKQDGSKDKNKSDGRVFIKGQGSSDFDIKI